MVDGPTGKSSLSVARAERLPMPRSTAVPLLVMFVPSIDENKGWTSETSDAPSALRPLAPPQKEPLPLVPEVLLARVGAAASVGTVG